MESTTGWQTVAEMLRLKLLYDDHEVCHHSHACLERPWPGALTRTRDAACCDAGVSDADPMPSMLNCPCWLSLCLGSHSLKPDYLWTAKHIAQTIHMHDKSWPDGEPPDLGPASGGPCGWIWRSTSTTMWICQPAGSPFRLPHCRCGKEHDPLGRPGQRQDINCTS